MFHLLLLPDYAHSPISVLFPTYRRVHWLFRHCVMYNHDENKNEMRGWVLMGVV